MRSGLATRSRRRPRGIRETRSLTLVVPAGNRRASGLMRRRSRVVDRLVISTSSPCSTRTAQSRRRAPRWPLAPYISVSARWISSAASFRATPRRSTTGPSRRQTTPTSTRTGRGDQPAVVARPVVEPRPPALNRSAISTASAQPGRSGIRKQNSSPPNRACRSRDFAGAFEREKILGPDLVGQDLRDALDDPVADGVAERVVVPLEAVDIDDADAAPADALLDGEERFDPLHEPVEVEQLGLRDRDATSRSGRRRRPRSSARCC